MSTWKELVQYCVDQKHAFVVWNEPAKEGQRSVGQLIASPVRDTIRIPNEEDAGFVIHPFSRESNLPQLFFPAKLYLREDDPANWDQINTPFLGGNDAGENEPHFAFQPEYLKMIEAMQAEINGGSIYKVIGSRVKSVESLPKSDWSELYFALINDYPKTFNYLFYHPAAGTWMGATPEVLLSGKEGTYTTMSLAGTQQADKEEGYEWSEKEKVEQQWVTDFIDRTLSKALVEDVVKSDTEALVAGPVAHLLTSFSFNYEGSPLQLGDKLHPTPAVCGFPVDSAMRIIQDLETHDRQYYTGFLGKIDGQTETQLYVNLRCMRLDGPSFQVFVGGGITDKSIGEDEWEETERKAQTLVQVIEKVRRKS